MNESEVKILTSNNGTINIDLLARFQDALVESSRLKQVLAAEQDETVVATARRLTDLLIAGAGD